MTRAIIKSEQTELGKLVDKREELQTTVASLKKELKYLNQRPAFNATAKAKEREDRLSALRASIDSSESKALEYAAAEVIRLGLLEDLHNEYVRSLLKQGGYGSFKHWAKYYGDQAQRTRAALENTKELYANEQIVDPRIAVTNSLAEVEQQLAIIRRQLRDAM